jgi:hypothetical protein
MRYFAAPALPVLLAALLAGPAVASAEPIFRATLTGAQEFPGPGNPDARGTFRIAFNNALTEAKFQLTVFDLPGTTRAHLHCAAAGAAGPIFIHLIGDMPMPLKPGSATDRTPQTIDGPWLRSATLTDESFSSVSTECGATLADLATAIAAGKVYVNVHTNALPPARSAGSSTNATDRPRGEPGRGAALAARGAAPRPVR